MSGDGIYAEYTCINRIRLEFKVLSITAFANTGSVLIESDWNLKYYNLFSFKKDTCINRIRLEFKEVLKPGRNLRHGCINRIRLVFKDRRSMEYLRKVLRINRIRLEFKAS